MLRRRTVVEISVTPVAQAQFRRLVDQKGAEWFRVHGAQDCQCGKIGFRVEMASAPAPEDEVVEIGAGPLRLLVSPAAREYVDGSTVDFSDDLMFTGFVVDNPRVQTWCGNAPR